MITPAGANARNHAIQSRSTWTVLPMISAASRLGASAVRNIELVTQVVAIAVHRMYAPMRRADGSFGSESYRTGKLRITGKIVPPLRAVFDGVNGASTRSAAMTA